MSLNAAGALADRQPGQAMIPVLVTDGEQRAALAVVRSLGRAGYEPYVCSSRRRPLAGGSRYARGEALVPDPLAEPERYLAAVEALITRWGVQVLLPITEASLLAILPSRSRIRAHLPFPKFQNFLSLTDKGLLLERAVREGIAVPRQWVIARPEEAHDISGEPLTFPLVIKPSRSIGGLNGGERQQFSVSYAADREELGRRLAAVPESGYPILLQQRVVGPGLGVFLLIWEDELVASFAHRRLREKPPSGGVSVYSESTALAPDLLKRSRALLSHFDWRGPAMIEYKLDEATRTPYLMEVNGRFWGSLQLAIDAGVDFPALLLAASRGQAYQPVHDYRTGIRLRWWWGDVDHLIARLRRSPAALALPTGEPGRWRVARDFLRFGGAGERSEVFRPSDPFPFLRESMDWLRRR